MHVSKIFFSDGQGQLTLQSMVESGRILSVIRDFIVVLVICQIEEDPIKNEGARVFTTYIDFSDAEGRVTPKSLVEIRNPSFDACPCFLQE